jgi:hypothetical protein
VRRHHRNPGGVDEALASFAAALRGANPSGPPHSQSDINRSIWVILY